MIITGQIAFIKKVVQPGPFFGDNNKKYLAFRLSMNFLDKRDVTMQNVWLIALNMFTKLLQYVCFWKSQCSSRKETFQWTPTTTETSCDLCLNEADLSTYVCWNMTRCVINDKSQWHLVTINKTTHTVDITMRDMETTAACPVLFANGSGSGSGQL